MNTEQRNILVTSALPYANGPIHIGHLVEYIQCDIWVRFQKMCGNQCIFVCADDAHGTPIMLKAEQEGVRPEDLISVVSEEHQRDFLKFGVSFDNYHSTHSEENRQISCEIYTKLVAGGYVSRKTIEQAYDPSKKMFLPDRFVKGSCPKCGEPDQYGDSCENCGATYSPTDLIDPISALSGEPPEVRTSEHIFFELGQFENVLKDWLKQTDLHPGVVKKLNDWFESGLQNWDISRDEPYFGFEIPGEKGKYFYVWLDAPVGYLASFKNFCDRSDVDFNTFLNKESDTEFYHFIGKDIMYFHTLFWPAMLEGAGYRLPTNVFVHGFLTVNGQKMSKSRGSFVKASTYLSHLEPAYLRYYFAAKLGPAIEDIDLNWEDFEARINSDLVGKFVNIGSRCSGFIEKRFDGILSDKVDSPDLLETFELASEKIRDLYESREFAKAMREIMLLADLANRYINDEKPWVVAKDPNGDERLHQVVTMGLVLFRIIAIYLKPVIPSIVSEIEKFFNEAPFCWNSTTLSLANRRVNRFIPLIRRVESGNIKAMVEEVKNEEDQPTPSEGNSPEGIVSIEDFSKVELRVGLVEEASHVDGADKLLKLHVDLGDEKRQIFAGIKQAYSPESLVGKLVVVVANLAPRKMRFGVSEGMVLAAGAGGNDVFLVEPSEGAEPGMLIK
ncbi:MAG: methionine--tRNA ligase [Gammaproteobacteria bacterium]